jgi:hypothetical protein
MKWVTREHVRVGRMACSWLITRYIDREAQIAYLPLAEVAEAIKRDGATPFHVRGAEFNHRDRKTPFELMLERYDLNRDPALALLGRIINGADTDNTSYNQPEGPGVRAVTEGFRTMGLSGDKEIVDRAAVVFDALLAYCQERTTSGKGA